MSQAAISSPKLSLNTLLDASGLGVGQAFVYALAGLAWVFDAIEITTISFLLPVLRCDFGLSNTAVSISAFSVYIGMGIGAAVWSWLADRYGRHHTLTLCFLSVGVFGFLSALAPSFLIFTVVRMLLGTGIGGSIPLACTLFLEFCPAKKRGYYGTLLTAWWGVGIIVAVALTWLILPALGWRVLVAVSSLFLLTVLPLSAVVGESPRFLLITGAHTRLFQCIILLGHRNGTTEKIHDAMLEQARAYAAPRSALARVYQTSALPEPLSDMQPSTMSKVLPLESAEPMHASADPHVGTLAAAIASESGALGVGLMTSQLLPPSTLRLWPVGARTIDATSVAARLCALCAPVSDSSLSSLLADPAEPAAPCGLAHRLRRAVSGGIPQRLVRFLPVLDPFTVLAATHPPAHLQPADQDAPLPALFDVPPASAAERGRVSDLFNIDLRPTTWRLLIIWFCASFVYDAYGLVLPLLFASAEPTCPAEFSTRAYAGTLFSAFAVLPFLFLGAVLSEWRVTGRRYAAAVSYIGTCLGLALLASARLLISPTGSIWAYAVFSVIIAATLGMLNSGSAILQIYATEVYPTKLRSVGVGLLSLVNRTAFAIAPIVLGVLLDHDIITLFIVILLCLTAIVSVFQLSLPISVIGKSLAEHNVAEPVAAPAARGCGDAEANAG